MDQPTILSLREMVGTLIVARIPAFDKENNVFVRLHRVEMSGIWVESKTFDQDMLEKYEIPASITALVLFIPFSGIEYIISSVECVSLSETTLGLSDQGEHSGMQTAQSKQARARRKRADTTLIFDPAQNVPGPVLDAILEEWLVPTLVEQFLRERGITRESLLTRYRTLE